MYYNTTQEPLQLKFDYSVINERRNDEVLTVFKSNPNTLFTPYEVGDELEKKGIKMLQSSVKRAITDLVKEGLLINTGIKKMERYGRNNYLIKLNQ